jgi:hypothetical protein
LDIVPVEGTLTVDSKRYLNRELDYDVIDIDSYGSPFQHYNIALRNISKPTIFFLTYGSAGVGYSAISRATVELVNFFPDLCDFRFSKTLIKGQIAAPALLLKVTNVATEYHLAQAYKYGHEVDLCIFASPGPTAKYFGLRTVPIK